MDFKATDSFISMMVASNCWQSNYSDNYFGSCCCLSQVWSIKHNFDLISSQVSSISDQLHKSSHCNSQYHFILLEDP